LASNNALSADCSGISGTTETITANCSVLVIDGDGSNVTINSGVTIDSTTNTAVKTQGSSNTTITNNGIISSDGNWGLRNNSPGDIDNLINNGTITTVKTAIRNSGSIV